ncbi:membrane lipoprotein lipid attachment site-containing protein [Tissierella sp. MB52-C2]|uniref:membrane lipoprotein lipid attachment site-containing protein n=1 Tax=Tissierella sp. MB52-C2 TaxID=3070999 RepID=UPI00280C2025|nr:membrane lipoprotein lipid attachment site-containing protein [Tissierella sp. MB52-C2]WMM23424.1 membrane lipoprotein lipid attachment site-containing protein [Tissierella sp. MB52-C2]
MRKVIFILGSLLILTGCSSTMTIEEQTVLVEDLGYIKYNKKNEIYVEYTMEDQMYINDEMKKVVGDINNLREKYKGRIDERNSIPLYLDIYKTDVSRFKNAIFSNNDKPLDEYFADIVEILDKSIAEGLKDYVSDMKYEKLQPNESISEKIGRTVVYTENRSRGAGNYIAIKVNFLDIKNDYHREVCNEIFHDKYFLDNVIVGEQFSLIDFVDPNSYYHYSQQDSTKTRYNIFLKDKDIEKTNILIQGDNGAELESDDIGVFINLINSLELSGEDKDLLLNEYKNIFDKKLNKKKITLDNYKVLINPTKGNLHSEGNQNLIYFSIERN